MFALKKSVSVAQTLRFFSVEGNPFAFPRGLVF